jgi:hypothetical protein
LPLAGGTMTGDITLGSSTSIKLPNSAVNGIHTSTDHRVIDSVDSTLRIGDTGKHNIIRLHAQGSDDFRVYYSATDYQIFHAGNSSQFTSTLLSKLNGIETGATADQTQSDINALGITQVGTISSGTWNGGVIASAYLDSDTAHLSGTQTFTGAKTFNSSVIIGGATYASYGSGSTDITGLINGSTFGSIQYASNSGHHVIGLRDNDNADSFAIISGTGNWATDSTYDKLVFRAQADGTVTVGGGNLGVTGNITLTGTVDGRDVATDGTKLDGIESGATADQTQSEINALGITATGLSGTPNISVGTISSDTIEINTAVNGNSHGLNITNSSLSGAGNLKITIPQASGNYSTASQLGGITIRNETTGGNIVVGAKDNVIIGVGGSDYDERLKVTTTGVDITGALTATTKSFDIEHPSKKGMRLHHGVVEGPEHSVYVRGKSKEKVILLPDYWVDLIHEDTITVQLTAIGSGQDLYVEDIKDNKVYVNGDNYFYYVQAERKDIDRFEVEYEV